MDFGRSCLRTSERFVHHLRYIGTRKVVLILLRMIYPRSWNTSINGRWNVCWPWGIHTRLVTSIKLELRTKLRSSLYLGMTIRHSTIIIGRLDGSNLSSSSRFAPQNFLPCRLHLKQERQKFGSSPLARSKGTVRTFGSLPPETMLNP